MIRTGYEKEFGYEKNYRNDNSQITNKIHNGAPYSVVIENDILTVKNKETGKSKTVDLNDFVKNFDMQRQPSVKAYLAKLPGEVLMDLFTEIGPLKQANSFDKILFKEAAACYNPITNNITLGIDECGDISEHIVHELGHAIDWSGKLLSSCVNKDKEFKASFKKELDNFIEHGGKQYKNPEDPEYIRAEGSSRTSTYATFDVHECFAECYNYLMTGTCNSADLLEDYFPETLQLAEKILQQIRNLPEDDRR